MKKVAIIQARMGSSRFTGKSLALLAGIPLIEWAVTRAKQIPLIDLVVVATSTEKQDDELVKWCQDNNIVVFRGSEDDVLARYYFAALENKADIVMRITGDCPFIDPNLSAQILYSLIKNEYDYYSNVSPATWPDGLDCETFTFKTLEKAHQQATKKSDREHVTSFIRNNQNSFKVGNLNCQISGIHNLRWSVDEKQDLEYLQEICKNLPEKINSSFVEILQIEENLAGILPKRNSKRNEGFEKSLTQDLESQKTQNINFSKSQELLKKSLKYIPVGSQTFSKSHLQYPKNTSPFFLTHGIAGRVWDVDGNEYVDLVSALLPNVLGYCDPDINQAIEVQLSKAISISLATEIEIELAEKLCQIIPSAQKVRFGKNGSDVTSAAIRLARAFTKRDMVIACGYHGWQDWYIGATTRNKGVPKSVSDLTKLVPYNDLQAMEDLLKAQNCAAVIMEPCNYVEPKDGYLQGVKDLCEKYGTVLIFDEIITGFRFSLGGAQEYFGVTPHLSCFGKAIANGMPLSAVVGRTDIMNEMEEIFFSGTFGGETLSIAAALATIKKIEKHNVIESLWEKGNFLANEVTKLIKENNLEEIISLKGYAPWKIIQFSDYDKNITAKFIKTFFMQEMIKAGVLIASSHNIQYSHNANDFNTIIKAYEKTLSSLKEFAKSKNFAEILKSPAIEPLFKVR